MPFDVMPSRKVSGATVLLLRAAGIISKPRAWNIGKANGRRLWRPTYCAIGALREAMVLYDLMEDEDDVRAYLDRVAEARGFTSMEALNDHPDTTHAVVMAVFREAAELSMAE